MKLKDAPDRELMSRLRASDSQAMEVLYDRYAGLVYSVAFKILRNSSNAEELTQDVFITLWQRDHYQPVKSREKTIINLENWFQEIFEAGWQMATELLETPKVTPAFRNSGVGGGRVISIDPDSTPIILIVRVTQTSTSNRDVMVEIIPELEQEYLPSGLQLMLLDSDGDTVMEATTRQENKNLKFDFTGTCGEAFSIKLELSNNCFQEDFIL